MTEIAELQALNALYSNAFIGATVGMQAVGMQAVGMQAGRGNLCGNLCGLPNPPGKVIKLPADLKGRSRPAAPGVQTRGVT